MATSQHCCVFVGKIPYDATEEQLIEICQEVGPVVSFRHGMQLLSEAMIDCLLGLGQPVLVMLVTDRETGNPKGYGFCEYKDEETALSACRNLQGYEINGRQLWVDFAENDKGYDRSREQIIKSKLQLVHGDAASSRPIGLQTATAAAAVMTGALRGPQVGSLLSQNGFQSQSTPSGDPLMLHLANLTRDQLNEVLSELKGFATRNKESARQLLNSRSQLTKALFQTGPSGVSDGLYDDAGLGQVTLDASVSRSNQYATTNVGFLKQNSRPAKLVKLEDRRGSSLSAGGVDGNAGAVPSQFGTTQAVPDADTGLLQQVLSLTAEQLSTLPPEQRQQVLQLQQNLGQDHQMIAD